MKNVLFAAGAALVVATSAVGASAGQPAAPTGSDAGAIIRIDDNRYYDDGYYGGGDSSWQYQYQDRGYNDDWRNADYGRRDADLAALDRAQSGAQQLPLHLPSGPQRQVLSGEGRQSERQEGQALHRRLHRPAREGEELADVPPPA